MDGPSILHLTSLPAIISAAIFLTYLAKRSLAGVPVASRIPVWVYTATIAGVLTFIASRVTGTLEGATGYLVLDGIINGALASGIREWITTIDRPLSESGTAREAILDRESGGLRSWFLPLLLAGALATSACAGLTPGPNAPAPVNPAPTEAQIQAVRAKALEIAAAVEATGNLVLEARRAASTAHASGLITREQRDAVNQAVIDLEPKVLALIDIAETVTTDPQLRATVRAFMSLIDELLPTLQAGSPPMASAAAAIRKALAVAVAYLGGAQ